MHAQERITPDDVEVEDVAVDTSGVRQSCLPLAREDDGIRFRICCSFMWSGDRCVVATSTLFASELRGYDAALYTGDSNAIRVDCPRMPLPNAGDDRRIALRHMKDFVSSVLAGALRQPRHRDIAYRMLSVATVADVALRRNAELWQASS